VDPGKDPRPDEAQLNAVFAATPIEELRQIRDSNGRALVALSAIEKRMRQDPGAEAAPTFEGLSTLLGRLDVVVRTQLAGHPSATPEEAGATGAGEGEPGASRGGQVLGAVKSREDAIRALDAVADFFRRAEPSSPVPLFVERAKRLVSKDFLDVLADVAPDGLTQARMAGGVKASE
jgi:type VI secretion system protein ImpA